MLHFLSAVQRPIGEPSIGWGPFILAFLGAFATVVGWITNRVFQTLDRTQESLNRVDRRLSNIEGRFGIESEE